MRTLKQSTILKEAFQQKIKQKVFSQRQVIQDNLGGILGEVGSGVFQFQQMRNQAKGYLGETFVLLSTMSLPDSWVLFKNAIIPTSSGDLTEIDLLIIGLGGVFLIEVKTWKGSFSAYKDKWKRRYKSQWISMENSPTQQSLYHKKMFHRWITSQISGLPQDFIFAPVVFFSAKWIGAKECSVPVIQGFMNLKQNLINSPICLTSEQVTQISEIIKNYEIEK